MQYRVTHSVGQAGYEEDISNEMVTADNATHAISLCVNPEHREWPVEIRDSEFATASNPEVSARYSDCYIAERMETLCEELAT